MIILKDISKTFIRHGNKSFNVLKEINLQINRGDIIYMKGESGAGKSTLLKILGMIDFRYEGEYLFEGRSVKSLSENRKARIRNEKLGYVFQNFMLIEDETVYENVRIPLYYSKKYKQMNHRRKVKEILTVFRIEELLDVSVSKLSGGERQRVAIARALVNDPDYLIMDEPISSIDPKISQEIMEYVYSYQKESECALIVVSHDSSVIRMETAKVLTLENGILFEKD